MHHLSGQPMRVFYHPHHESFLPGYFSNSNSVFFNVSVHVPHKFFLLGALTLVCYLLSYCMQEDLTAYCSFLTQDDRAAGDQLKTGDK